MEISKICLVEQELNRLQTAIAALRSVLAMNGTSAATLPKGQRYWDSKCCYSPKETGAVKRASMDLSRALSDLRKP